MGGPLNFGEALHRGQYAVIYKSSFPPDETPCVIKVYDWWGKHPDFLLDRLAFAELAAYANAGRHPHLQPLLDAHFWADTVQLVFPRYDFSLSEHAESCPGNRLPFEGSRRVGLAISLALEALRRAGLVHGDVKVENILLRKAHVIRPPQSGVTKWRLQKKYCEFGLFHPACSLDIVLSDLGCVATSDPKLRPTWKYANRETGSSNLAVKLGSPINRAPELMLGRVDFGPPVDSWSLGLVIWETLTGVHLFDSQENDYEHVQEIRRLFGPIPEPEVPPAKRRKPAELGAATWPPCPLRAPAKFAKILGQLLSVDSATRL